MISNELAINNGCLLYNRMSTLPPDVYATTGCNCRNMSHSYCDLNDRHYKKITVG